MKRGKGSGKRTDAEKCQTTSVRLAVIDNDPLSLAALMSVLRHGLPNIQIAWTALSAQQGLDFLGMNPKTISGSAISIGFDRPQILLIDMSMPDMDGITLTHCLRRHDGQLKILAMTSFPLAEYAADVAQAGAQGIVSKGRPGRIIEDIALLSHQSTLGMLSIDGQLLKFLPPNAAFGREMGRKPNGSERFTRTEKRIVRMCADGETTQEIADKLGVSTGTVTTHIQRMCTKIGARNRVQLVTLWLEQSRPRR